MTFNQRYQSVAPALANYNFSDISDGTGMQLFYGGETNISTGSSYILSSLAFYSYNITRNVLSTGTTPDSKCLDTDYDILLNTPRTIKGDVLVNFQAGTNSAGGTGTYTIYFKVYVRKWDGTTETTINSVQSATWTAAYPGTLPDDKTFTLKIPVTTTQFKAGEYIRITIEMYGWRSGSDANQTYMYGQDPANRNDPDAVIADASPTDLKIWIPFKLEV